MNKKPKKLTKKKYRLYDLPDNSPLRVPLGRPGKPEWIDDAIFRHIDGAFSLCVASDGGSFHLSAATPMKLVDGRWEIDWEADKK